jgi:threonine aldolase
MYSFKNDYSEGMHPSILKALGETNTNQTDGYGEDSYCLEAASMLREAMNFESAHIHFLAGGTQTNLTALGAFLRPHEAVISAVTGHINTHEAGAVEATGHRVVALASDNGKISPVQIQTVLDEHGTDEHMVKPRLVYISQSTELGTVYTKGELITLSRFCRDSDLLLYMDGARLGSALCAENGGLSLSDLPHLCDAFYIGGTKNGAMLGEALVITSDALNRDFRYHIKQRGGLMAKGRLLGLQFTCLFKDNLFYDLASHANHMAQILREGIQEEEYDFLISNNTNQIFPIFPDSLIEKLQNKYAFYIWAPHKNNRSAVRLVTSWMTPEKAVLDFVEDMKTL